MQPEDLIQPFQRAVAPPGQFETLFPEADDDTVLGYLTDGLGRAQLDGFLTSVDLDEDTFETDPELTRPQGALIVMYAAKRVLEVTIINLKTHVKYEAGPVSFEEDQAASVLVELLRGLKDELIGVLTLARQGSYEDAFYMADLYLLRAPGHSLEWDMPELPYVVPVP